MIYAKLVSDKRTQDKRRERKDKRNKGIKEYHASAFVAFARFSHFGNVKTAVSKSTIFNIYNISIL